MEAYFQLENFYKEIGILNSISALAQWDNDVYMPKGGLNTRTEQMIFLSQQIHQRIINPKIIELAENCKNLDLWQQRNVELIKKSYLINKALDQNLIQEITKSCLECEANWREARKSNNFKLFSVYFKKQLKLIQEKSQILAEILSLSQYDALLDCYDPGRRSSEIDQIFSQLKNFLPSFIQSVIDKQKSKPKSKNFSLPIDEQKKLGLKFIEALGFDLNRGRLDISTHPFSTGFSPDDVRITARYEQDNPLSGIFAILHEAGHGIYEQNLPIKYQFQPVGKASSMTIHESQSLFVERHIGVNKNFFIWFAENIEGASCSGHIVDELYNQATLIGSSMIRVDADEVTYPAHIILRYELEKSLLTNQISVEEMPEAWEEISLKLLGKKPASISEGVLQDIHWAWGAIGYFPTYTLGAIFSSQLDLEIRKNLDMDHLIRTANFKSLSAWLKKNIHSFGSLYDANGLISNSVNNILDVNIFINYLKNKYLEQ